MKELPKTYTSQDIERKWYEFWEENKFFEADPSSDKPPYCIVIPPPNVTGALHMGHALVDTLQDILIRWKRMQGFETLWVPGVDHAGISTQTVVERHLIKTTGKRRVDHSREEFLKAVWAWKEENEGKIVKQIKRLGCSCDWSRYRFTMDEGNNKAVRSIFTMLYKNGLIYRGDYLVNWDPLTQTALSDDEVEYEERLSSLWHFRYPLSDGSGYLEFATTRPETMLGDLALAVAPGDARYSAFVGKTCRHPFSDRLLPVIADHMVDPTFGTGVVKITPAHDPNDYQMGLRHGLALLNIMTKDGKINENGAPFQGLTMEECRQKIIPYMQEKGLFVKAEPHVNRVGVSYRSKAVIEPFISKQWFVRMSDFAKELRYLVEKGQVSILPKPWETVYYRWVDNLRDWCISRQLWWGHRIPIWYHVNDSSRLICQESDEIPDEVRTHPDEWKQEEDVLDTWFSSALWPFASLGWPEKTEELTRFYPNATLITGHDIIFFWVARMLFMGNYVNKKPPFPAVYLHGLIYGKSYWREQKGGGIAYLSEAERKEYDLGKPLPEGVFSKWEKMSKTKGNIIDPLEMIAEYGTDAMRMALALSPSASREIDLDRRKFEENRNFANKVWNGARFVLMNLPSHFDQGLNASLFTLEDKWILSQLNEAIRAVNEKLTNYEFDNAANLAYTFFWDKFCAYYVEVTKPYLFGKAGTEEEKNNKQKILAIVLDHAIRLLHPMAPFITEELFHLLKEQLGPLDTSSSVDPYTHASIKALTSPACIVAPYPEVISASDINPTVDATFDLVRQAVYAIRNIRGEMRVPPGTPIDIYFVGDASDPTYQIIEANTQMIRSLVRSQKIETLHREPALGFACTAVLGNVLVMIPLPKELLLQEQERLKKEWEKLTKTVEGAKKRLENTSFVENAPPHIIIQQRETLAREEQALREISTKLAKLSLKD